MQDLLCNKPWTFIQWQRIENIMNQSKITAFYLTIEYVEYMWVCQDMPCPSLRKFEGFFPFFNFPGVSFKV